MSVPKEEEQREVQKCSEARQVDLWHVNISEQDRCATEHENL